MAEWRGRWRKHDGRWLVLIVHSEPVVPKDGEIVKRPTEGDMVTVSKAKGAPSVKTVGERVKLDGHESGSPWAPARYGYLYSVVDA